MKFIRYCTLISSALVLTLLCVGTASTLCELVQVGGIVTTVNFVWEDPSVLVDAYYRTLGDMNLNQHWFGDNGPVVMLGLLVTLLVASLP